MSATTTKPLDQYLGYRVRQIITGPNKGLYQLYAGKNPKGSTFFTIAGAREYAKSLTPSGKKKQFSGFRDGDIVNRIERAARMKHYNELSLAQKQAEEARDISMRPRTRPSIADTMQAVEKAGKVKAPFDGMKNNARKQFIERTASKRKGISDNKRTK
jgi:hypothetical protein